jgi:hypothetical protein
VERDDAPDKEDERSSQNQQRVGEREIDSPANPSRISCMPSGARPSATMAILRN